MPVAFAVTGGQQHDSRSALPLIAQVDPSCLLGDKAYDVDAIREDLQAREAAAVIPPKANRRSPAPFDKELYKARSAVELAQTQPIKSWCASRWSAAFSSSFVARDAAA